MAFLSLFTPIPLTIQYTNVWVTLVLFIKDPKPLPNMIIIPMIPKNEPKDSANILANGAMPWPVKMAPTITPTIKPARLDLFLNTMIR